MAQELKVYNVVAKADVNPDVVDILGCTEWAGYDKDEVDAVLAEKDAAIAELKAENERLKNWPHTDNTAVIELLTDENERLKAELAALKEERRWRKFSEEKPVHHQWIFVINPNRSKYASPIEIRRWDDEMKFDVEVQELYKVWLPQMETPEE